MHLVQINVLIHSSLAFFCSFSNTQIIELMAVENWTYEDFKAYLFIYCSFADHLEVDKERKVAIQKIGEEKYNTFHAIIEKDTDDVGINKIRKYVKLNKISKEKVNDLLWDVADMFLSDGVFHKLEKRLYSSLERIFQKVYPTTGAKA